MERKQQTGAPFNSAPFRLRRAENSGQNNLAASRNEAIRRREALEQLAKGTIVCQNSLLHVKSFTSNSKFLSANSLKVANHTGHTNNIVNYLQIYQKSLSLLTAQNVSSVVSHGSIVTGHKFSHHPLQAKARAIMGSWPRPIQLKVQRYIR